MGHFCWMDGWMVGWSVENITTLTVPVQKKPPPKEPARRVRGKLSKKEQKAMKSSHKDIGWLLAPPPTRETVIHEKAMEKETEDMEIVDEEREARIERMRRKALEWKAAQTCKGIVMDLIEEAVLESEWREECSMSLVLEMVEDAVTASRERMCRSVLEESVLEVCWEALEVTRIIKEVEVGGMTRIEKVETQLRGLREDEETLLQAISEDAARTKRMEKTERLKRAWKLTMEHRKCQMMIQMMGTLSVLELDMEMEWIETKVLELMDCEVEESVEVGLKDEDGDQIMPEEDSLTKMEMEVIPDMVKEYGQKVVDDIDMNTLPGKTEMIRMEDSLWSMSGSVVGVESLNEYPHHCGGGHTPLLGPATIPENGVELGWVIGLQPTEGNDTLLTEDMTDCVTEGTDEAHTPTLGPGLCTDMTGNMMRVLHTPVLRPTCTLNKVANTIICNNSGAGIVTGNNGDIDINIQSKRYNQI
jgi:hypothetical protein